MAIFEKFPYTNLHNLNLDWMINKMKEFQEGYEDQLEQIQAVQTATEELQRALQEDEGNLADAVEALNDALEALPQDIQNEVAFYVGAHLGTVVAGQLPAVTASQLPTIVRNELPGEFADWMDEHFTEPPIDPTMTMAYGVPSARATGNIFDYLEGLAIEGYTNSKDSVSMVVDGTGVWGDDGSLDAGASNSMGCHFEVTGGLVYRLTNWQSVGSLGVDPIIFGQGPVVSTYPRFVPISSISNADLSQYQVQAGVYDIPVPKGADLMLVNSMKVNGEPAGPDVKGYTFNFKGGSELRGLSFVSETNNYRFTGSLDEIDMALYNGRPVTFKFPHASDFGDLYARVISAKTVREFDRWDIVLLTTDNKILGARLDTSNGTYGYLQDITTFDIGAIGGKAYTLVSEGSGDYSIADTTLAELRADLATNIKNVELVYPSTYGTATVIGYRAAGAQGEDLIVLRADGKAVSYSVTEQGSDLYLQQVSISKNVFDTSTGVILDATAGTGDTFELDGESIASLTSLAEDGTPVWISWPATGTDQNLSQVVGWDIQTASFGMTCIDGEGNYRKLSAVDGTDTVVLTVVTESDVNQYYDYTPTVAEQQAIATVMQSFIMTGVQQSGTPIHVSTNADFSSWANAVETAYSNNKIFRVKMTFGQLEYCIISSASGNNGASSCTLPYVDTIPGVGNVYAIIETLVFETSIHESGTVFVL